MEPARIGNYRVLAKLGEGGMGTVYRARNESLGREVALKVLRLAKDDAPEWRARLLREARALAAISHPRVVSCYDAGSEGDRFYLAMELLTGGDCAQLMKAGPLPERRALEIIRDAAEGAHAVHLAGLIHRDIKPANIFLDQDGGAKLADLGLVRPALDRENLTRSDTIVGTPAYLSPEQAAAAETIDARSDVYSLGATLYALLGGRQPFSGASPWLVVAEILRDPTPDPRRVRPDISDAARAIVRRAMARDPRARFASARAMAESIGAALEGSPARRLRWLPIAAAAAVALLCLIGGAIALGSNSSPDRRAPVPAALPPRAPPAKIEPPTSATAPAPIPAVVARTPDPLPVVAGPPAPWAAARGTDSHGPWAELAVGEAKQRFRWCAPGSFRMGSPEDEVGRYGNELAHAVTLTRGFWLGETEVTRGLWRRTMGGAADGDDALPMASVSWTDCHDFIAKLGVAGTRLPTEAEWEYACRAGTTTPAAGDIEALAWHRGNAGGTAHPTAARTPNAWGLYDLHGNLWEWCEDGYGDFTTGSATDPCAVDGLIRVIRGGSFRYAAGDCRSALRDGAAPQQRRDSIGFRLAVGEAPTSSRPPSSGTAR